MLEPDLGYGFLLSRRADRRILEVVHRPIQVFFEEGALLPLDQRLWVDLEHLASGGSVLRKRAVAREDYVRLR